MNGLVFGSYGFILRQFKVNGSDEPRIWQVAVAGAGSGIVAS